jgi:hypothetical protein
VDQLSVLALLQEGHQYLHSPNCCGPKLPAAEELEGSAWFLVIEVKDAVSSAGVAQHRFNLEWVDGCNELVLRKWDLTEHANADKACATSIPSQS